MRSCSSGWRAGTCETGGVVVDQVLADIETLNRAAFDGRYEVSAVSFHAYAHLVDKYALLPHGASMGDKYGPIVVARQDAGPQGVKGSRVAIPGTLTTAYLALRIYEPAFEYVVVPFDEIQQTVLDGKADAGLLIHEGQLTYQDEGLRKIVDLGEWWAERTGGLPLPLGGNIIRRDLGPEMIAKVSKILHDSIAYALSHRPEAVEYALQFGRGLDRAKTDRFVGMYVNDLTLEYGDRGRRGLERLLSDAFERGPHPPAGAGGVRGVKRPLPASVSEPAPTEARSAEAATGERKRAGLSQARWSDRFPKTKPSRSTVSPTRTSIRFENIGPATAQVWNSPRSPQGTTLRQGRQEGVVIRPSRKRCGKNARVDAGEVRLEAAGEHVACERGGRAAPQRKDRRQPGAGHPRFAVASHVLEKQIAERDVREPLCRGGGNRGRHPRSSRSSGHGEGMGTETSGSPAASAWARRTSDLTAYIATLSTASFIVVRRAAGVPVSFGPEYVKHPRAVLATAPGDQHFHFPLPAPRFPLPAASYFAKLSGCSVRAKSSTASATRGPGTTVRWSPNR